jgi:hypothetical protein
MTPEERFTRIENLLNAMTEHQARFDENALRHDREIAEIRELQNAFAAGMLELKEDHQRNEQEIHSLREMIRANAEAQRIGEEKLHTLVEIVEQIIRGRKS